MTYYKVDDEKNIVQGFYKENLHQITPDMISISEETWQDLLDKQSQGYTLCCNLDGTLNPQLLKLGETWDGEAVLANLEPPKERLNIKVTEKRDLVRETATVDYNGHAQRYRKKDLADLDYYQGRLRDRQNKAQEEEDALAVSEGREPVTIILELDYFFYDGSSTKLKVEDFDDIKLLTDDPTMELYRKEATLKYMVSQLTTTEEVEGFDIEGLWDTI